MDINQVEERAPMGTPRNLATIHENFSGFQAAASLQLRNLGRAGVEKDVAVWWPLTLRISSERYVVRPERSGESAASPKLAAPAWQMPPRSGLKYTKIPAVGVAGMWKCCQSGRICVSHPCVLRLETTRTTGKNNFERGARARGLAPKASCFK